MKARRSSFEVEEGGDIWPAQDVMREMDDIPSHNPIPSNEPSVNPMDIMMPTTDEELNWMAGQELARISMEEDDTQPAHDTIRLRENRPSYHPSSSSNEPSISINPMHFMRPITEEVVDRMKQEFARMETEARDTGRPREDTLSRSPSPHLTELSFDSNDIINPTTGEVDWAFREEILNLNMNNPKPSSPTASHASVREQSFVPRDAIQQAVDTNLKDDSEVDYPRASFQGSLPINDKWELPTYSPRPPDSPVDRNSPRMFPCQSCDRVFDQQHKLK
jgi:hypothetical protein